MGALPMKQFFVYALIIFSSVMTWKCRTPQEEEHINHTLQITEFAITPPAVEISSLFYALKSINRFACIGID
jgi:hypothetical protein